MLRSLTSLPALATRAPPSQPLIAQRLYTVRLSLLLTIQERHHPTLSISNLGHRLSRHHSDEDCRLVQYTEGGGHRDRGDGRYCSNGPDQLEGRWETLPLLFTLVDHEAIDANHERQTR